MIFSRTKYFCRSEIELKSAWRCYTIAADLLLKTLVQIRKSNEVVLGTLEIFLLSIAIFDQIHTTLYENPSKVVAENKKLKFPDQHLSTFEKQREKIVNWLKGLTYADQEKNYLQVNMVHYYTLIAF